jgi:hypothetical protein
MPTIGFEVATAAKLLAPLIKDIYEGAKDSAALGFKKWKTKGFAQKLAKKISTTDKIKTIWSPDKDISLIEFYFPSRISLKNKPPIIANSLNDLGSRNIVIEGIVGQGKSILLRYLCLQELSGLGSSRIPLFIELRTLAPGKSLRHYIYQALDKLDLSTDDDVFEYLAETGKLVLFLDGFDELNNNLVSDTINEIEFITEKYQNLQIIITSRPENEIQKSRHFEVAHIANLSEHDYPEFLERLKISAIRRAEIILAIKESPSNVAELVNTPLMLTLLVMVYESEKEIPSELPEFFEKLFHVVFTKHDRLKAGFNREHYSGLSERKLRILFEAFCFMVLQNHFGRSLTIEQFNEAFGQAIDFTENCECESEKFRKDITKVACLMLEEGFDTTTFLHKSILEYHAAAFIKHASEEVSKLFYESIRTQYEDWQQVASFLQKIDPYRHTKYYLIPSLNSMLELLRPDRGNLSHNSIEDFISSKYSDIGVSYKLEKDILEPKNSPQKKSSSEAYIAFAFGPFKTYSEPIGHLGESIRKRILNIMRGSYPTQINKSQIIENMDIFIPDRNQPNTYKLLLKKASDIYDIKLLDRLLDFEHEIKNQLTAAKKILDAEDKKKLIFSKNKIQHK